MNLTRAEYETLKEYQACNGPIPIAKTGITETISTLAGFGLIEVAEYFTGNIGGVYLSNHPISYIITPYGLKAIDVYETERTSRLLRAVLGHFLSFLLGVLASIIANKLS